MTRPHLPLSQAARIALAMLLGGLVGYLLGPRAAALKGIGQVIIDLIKALAGPLVLLAILDAFLRTEVKARSGGLMVGISMANAALALAIGLGLSNWIRPGDALRATRSASMGIEPEAIPAAAQKGIDLVEQVKSYVPTNVVKPFLDNSIIHIVILTVLIAAALRHVKNRQIASGEIGYRTVEDFVTSAYQAIEVLIRWVVLLIPLAVFGVIASTIGLHGFGPLRGLAVYVGVAILGMLIQVGITYQLEIRLIARRSLDEFWRASREPIAYALGASSSLVTMPVTLSALEKLRVSTQAARLSACVGTNLNNDGILLYEAMAVLCVAQYHQIPMSVGEQMIAAGACLVAGIGIAGIPDAGLISLLVVLNTVKLPLELYPLLLSVDWILSRARAMTNVTSDVVVAVLLDHLGVGRESEGQGGEAPISPA
ncbi:MAG: dicarboxylate/amino acid:cation symporter [Isosphaeraceae bacterium]